MPAAGYASASADWAQTGRKRAPDMYYGGGGDGAGPDESPDVDAGEAEAQAVDDAIAAAQQAVEGVVVDDNPWADTIGGCPVFGPATCGDPRADQVGLIASEVPNDPLAAALEVVVRNSLLGFTEEQTQLVIAAWNVLVRNFDLVQWALCVTTGDPESGGCIEDLLLGLSPVTIALNAAGCSGGDIDAVTHTVEFLDIFQIFFGIPSPGLFDPFISFCSGGSSDYLDRSMDLFTNGLLGARDCGVLSFAGLLLHELTHACNRAYWEEPATCAVSYLTQNYFVFGARTRYARMDASPCCVTQPSPGVGYWGWGLNFENLTFTIDNLVQTWVRPRMDESFQPQEWSFCHDERDLVELTHI